uniref:Vacuolar protein sorting-associated protein 11 like n=1 Tax=Talaromyces marneffei PM1 TaxID=1077442 RepID=A0A093VNI3_TALMA
MPTRRQISRLNLEEASTNDYEDCWLLGSDDELDEATRAVKRRRIESLGEAYLKGTTLFIASASLRGPFDKGWVNPWKKHRKPNESGVTRTVTGGGIDDVAEFAVPDTNESRKYKGRNLSRVKSVRSDVRGHSLSPRTTPHRGSGQSKSSWNRESSISHAIPGPSADVQPAQAWLKRDKKVINIQNYDPPKSPSSRYASSGADGSIKLPKTTSKRAEPGLARAMKSHQTDLRNVRRNKLVSGDSQEKHAPIVPDGTSSTSPGKQNYQKPVSDTKQGKTSLLSKITDINNPSDRLHGDEDDVLMEPDPVHNEKDMPASASSVHILPPSSRLPEFKYRLAKTQSREGTENQSEHVPSRTENNFPPVDSNCDRQSSPFKAPLPKSQQDQASIPAQSTVTLTCSEKPNESLTESEKLPSAQIVPKPPGTSNCFISLHSAEYRVPDAAETGTTSVDGELSTQAAFELAQKSFQDDLATPHRSSQSPPRTRKSAKSSVRRITPFTNVNNNRSTFDIKIGLKNTPGTNHNMNTQTMIEAFTPFSDAGIGEAGKETAGRSGVHIVNAQAPNDTDRAASPHSQPRSKPPPHSPSFQAEDSLPPLPLTLSGTTPATNQQDGQGYLFSQDAFDNLGGAVVPMRPSVRLDKAKALHPEASTRNNPLYSSSPDGVGSREMALTSKKAFNFFEVSQVQVPDDSSAVINDDVACICTGSDNLFIGSNDGKVHILSHTFRIVRSFNAHDAGVIGHMRQIEGTSLLVTIAEDLPNEPVLKVWALDKIEKKTGAPRRLSTVSVQNGRRPFPLLSSTQVSTFVCLEDLSQVAVGFANGSVAIIRGDLINDRGARQRIVFESQEPITGLEVQHGHTITTLFIATTNRILTLTIAGRGQGQPARVLEDAGCALGCMALDKETGDILIAREDAIHTYGLRGRGPSFAYDSPKHSLNLFKGYVALVCPPKTAASKSDPLHRFSVGQTDDIFNTTTFTFLDTI